MIETTKTILMTDTAPVRIVDIEWPVIAHGDHSWFSGIFQDQSKNTLEIDVWVRKHADGRVLVYGRFERTFKLEEASNVLLHAGRLYTNPTSEVLVKGIRKIGMEICPAEQSAADPAVTACIADLPPLDI